jgi:hypothetical protein
MKSEKFEENVSFLPIIFSLKKEKETICSVNKRGYCKLKAKVEPQQAHIQNGEQNSVTSWWG